MPEIPDTVPPSYATPDVEPTVRPLYAQELMGEVQLLTLYELEHKQRVRLEAPTVIGRSPTFHRYPDSEKRFTEEDAKELTRLDYVRIPSPKDMVSRTHGVIDPTSLTIRDLNSMHGIRVNGALIARNAEHPGPPHPLQSNDRLLLGDTKFLVRIERIGAEDLLNQLAESRTAMVGPREDAETDRLAEFLTQHKRFAVQPFSSWSSLLSHVGALQRGSSDFGVLVLALVVEPLGGDRLRFAGEEVSLDALLFTLANLRGSKVLALQSEGDPSGLEHAFLELAFQDTILLTSSISSTGPELDSLEPDMGTVPIEAMRKAVSRGEGTYDSVLDGLDALIRPESNVLDVDWAETYRGGLRLLVGTRFHDDNDEASVVLSYQPSDLEMGSYRVSSNLSRPENSEPYSPTLSGIPALDDDDDLVRPV